MATRKKVDTSSKVGKLIHAAYEQRASASLPGDDNDWRRDHLGASVIGHECDRFLWLSFRWAKEDKKDGRMLRLLQRGKDEESRLLRELEEIGIRVVDTQVAVDLGDGVGGSADAVLLGVPEAPDEPHVGEFKTSNAKQFARLVEKGVKAAQPKHWAQAQTYMHGLGLKWALYVAVCKDNDEIHTERIPYDEKAATEIFERARSIARMELPPHRLIDKLHPPCVLTSKDGTAWSCQFYDLCHGEAVLPERNCRTCGFADFDGVALRCMSLNDGLPKDRIEQRAGCGKHRAIRQIVNGDVAAVEVGAITYQSASGKIVVDRGPE